jgi:hypothetical protein
MSKHGCRRPRRSICRYRAFPELVFPNRVRTPLVTLVKKQTNNVAYGTAKT